MATSGEGSDDDNWSWQQVKAFERALIYFPEGCEARWEKIAALIPGEKSPQQVIDLYNHFLDDVAAIEAGLPVLPKEPATGSSSEEGSSSVPREPNREEPAKQKRKRRKPVAWTEQEHLLFLLGLESVGRGGWKVIAREFVKTRDSAQVASHAQKFFKRQKIQDNQSVKRWSIFDMTSLDDLEQQTRFKWGSYGFLTQNRAPFTINRAPFMIKDTPPLVMQEAPFVIKDTPPLVTQKAPFVINEAPLLIKETPLVPKSPLVMQEAALVMQETVPVMQEAPQVIQEVPSVMQETALVMQEAPPVTQQAPSMIKNTTLVIQEGRDGGIMVGPRIESPSLSPMERFCLQLDADDPDLMLQNFFSQLSPL